MLFCIMGNVFLFGLYFLILVGEKVFIFVEFLIDRVGGYLGDFLFV